MKQRAIILVCILIILLAMILGIVFGTRERQDNKSTQSSIRGSADEEPVFIPLTNDKCNESSVLPLDGSTDVGVIATTSLSTFSDFGGACGGATYGQGPGIWYRARGTGSTFNLSTCVVDCTVPVGALVIPEVAVFTGDCDGLVCINGTDNLLETSPLQFRGIRGQDYFIYISGRDNGIGLLEISLNEA